VNRACNPACAYSDHYNCPIPPKANTLNVAIRAGERDSHYHLGMDTLTLIGILVAYFVLQTWILPKFGVPT